jgi:hypothetical protein
MNREANAIMDITWEDVPVRGHAQPVRVLVETRVWRKIGEKHMANPQEPWDEWMEPNLVSAFRALWPLGCREATDRETVEMVSEQIRQDALVSLAAPLLMTYAYRRLGGSATTTQQRSRTVGDPEPTQRLVLPNGARAEIRRGAGETWSMRTCYFDDDVAGRGTPPWQRYRKLVAKLKTRYARSPGDPEQGVTDTYLKDDTIETGIEFVSPKNWGLDSPTPDTRNLPEPWPQPPVLPAAPPAGLLNPRSPGGGTRT